MQEHLFGIRFDAITQREAVGKILTWAFQRDGVCRYVVTPNVDHVVKLETDAHFRDAYDGASLIVVDGKPVRLASRLLGKPLPETIPGSELCPAILRGAERYGRLKVFLLGAAPGVADKAAMAIQKSWPWVEVVGTYSPGFGFSASATDSSVAIERINAANPDLLIIGLGAPKQEVWIKDVCSRLKVGVAICAGATIDFIAGQKVRAPRWCQNLGLEWLHRALSEPRRLAPRYWHDLRAFPRIVYQEWRLLKSR